MDDPLPPIASENTEPEDLALEALLALRKRWNAARGTREGVTLQTLGLEIEPQERYLSAVCDVHGRFHLLWSAAASADRPQRIECPGDWQVRCGREGPVDFVYAPARPRD
jgi:hypothetical protein